MPLVVMCGVPGSGKSKKTQKIKEFFENVHKKHVDVVSEEKEIERAGFHKESVYLQSQQEKHLRSVLKSEVMKFLNKDDVVILDSGNYIKGYRYELYCGSKSLKSTQCTVYTLCNIEQAKQSSTLQPDTFDALVHRFEEPNGNNRWDSPLVVWSEDNDEEMLTNIYKSLYETAPPPPNLSTQNAPMSDSKFLQRLDEVTREVCERAAQGLLPGLPLDTPPAPPHLSRLRRQFLTYAKMNLSSTDLQDISHLFTQYLKTTLKE